MSRNDDIRAYVAQNIDNPQAIASGMTQYEVSAEDLANATGYTLNDINTYFSGAGVSVPSIPLGTSGVTGQNTPTSPVTSQPAIPTTSRDYLLPGESGAGTPTGYMKSPLYAEWLSRQPKMEDYLLPGNEDPNKSMAWGKALESWQESNPYYVNPKKFDTFDGYLSAVANSTGSDNVAARNDPYRLQSFLKSYYGDMSLAPSIMSSSSGFPSEEALSKMDPSLAAYYRRMRDYTNSVSKSDEYMRMLGATRNTYTQPIQTQTAYTQPAYTPPASFWASTRPSTTQVGGLGQVLQSTGQAPQPADPGGVTTPVQNTIYDYHKRLARGDQQ